MKSYNLFITVLLICIVYIRPNASGVDFSDISKGLLFFETESGKGSGFICKMDTEVYAITNAHVLGNGKGLKIFNLNRKELQWSKMEASGSSGLVRLLINNIPKNSYAFEIENTEMSIGDIVVVYGNSLGSEVFTELKGNINGLGPTEIEVSSEFVSGNSGSPILNADGKVIAVATYVSRVANPDNWVLNDTRFSKTRRFGLRLESIEWQKFTLERVQFEEKILKDIDTYITQISSFLPTWMSLQLSDGSKLNSGTAKSFLLNYKSSDRKHEFSDQRWPKDIHDLVDKYFLANTNYWEREITRYSNRSSTYRQRTQQMEDRKNAFSSHLSGIFKTTKQILSKQKYSTYYTKAYSDDIIFYIDHISNLYESAMKKKDFYHFGLWYSGLYERSKNVDSIEELPRLQGGNYRY